VGREELGRAVDDGVGGEVSDVSVVSAMGACTGEAYTGKWSFRRLRISVVHRFVVIHLRAPM